MNPTAWTEDEASSFLAGMKSVATLRGTRPLEALAREMLDAVRKHVLHANTDIETLPDSSPEELATQIQEPRRRQECIQFLIPYLPMQVDAEQVTVVDEIARATASRRAPDRYYCLRQASRTHRLLTITHEAVSRSRCRSHARGENP